MTPFKERGQQEQRIEGYDSRISLHFTRHGEKEKDPNKSNRERLMTAKGRQQAIEKGKKREGRHDAAMAFGSHVVRSQQVAGYEMAIAQGRTDITGDETLEELKAKLDQDLEYGHRVGEDKRLGFDFYDKEYERITDEAYDKKQGLKFVVEESDQLAEKMGDSKSISYSRAASNIAQVVEKYIKIAPTFNTLVSDSEKREQYGDTMERFMGSHAGVIDCFLAKVVEKIKGVEERDALVRALGNQGFDETEGFEVDIVKTSHSDEPSVRVMYDKKDKDGNELFHFDEVVSPETLKEIIEEGEVENV
ncbi:MAG: hypothetical protein WC289_00855 [Patescibacteria group bacterium]|jgi:hypothetical protein